MSNIGFLTCTGINFQNAETNDFKHCVHIYLTSEFHSNWC